MKNTTIDNPEVKIKDKRIITLDEIVNEVKQSEEWEAVKMNILEIGIEKGREEGREEGRKDGLQDGLKIGRAEGEAKLVSMIRRKLEKGLSVTAISEALELEDAYVQKVINLITEDSSKSDLEIAKILLR